MRVIGKLGALHKSYAFGALTDQSQDELKFKFKYFQNFEGTLVLPAGFEPQSVEVEVRPRGKRLQPISQRFEWNSLITGG